MSHIMFSRTVRGKRSSLIRAKSTARRFVQENGSRKDVAFGLRALAQAKVVQLMWTGMSFFDGKNYIISKRDIDARGASPLDTFKVSKQSLKSRTLLDHPNFPLHVYLHEKTKKKCCVVVHNSNASWLSAQKWVKGSLPAWDCNCAMFAKEGEVTEVNVPYQLAAPLESVPGNESLGPHTKVGILPNRAVAIFGDSIDQTVMRSIYLNFAIETMRSIEVSGRENARLTSQEQLREQNNVWDTNPTFTEATEMKILKKSMNLPLWWDRVELSDYSDSNSDELQLLAAVDMPANTKIAIVGGNIVCEPTMHTVRLAPKVHLEMTDGGGSEESIFTRLNHSFTPNLRATPKPEQECVVFKTLRMIKAGEPLNFDYTSTEDSNLAAPFIDGETGEWVGK
jgi:ribulose-5-phosphate 4-epimerase/fuculose-1-phosphate aldolase